MVELNIDLFLEAIMKACEDILKAFDWAWCVKTLIAYRETNPDFFA